MQPKNNPNQSILFALPDLLAEMVMLNNRIDQYVAAAQPGHIKDSLAITSDRLTRTALLISADLASKRLAQPTWVYDDGGRKAAGFTGTTRDCVTRAIAIATGMEYRQVYDLVNEFAKTERKSKRRRTKSNARTGVHTATIRRIMKSLGWRWVPTMGIGSGCTVHVKASELPAGRLVLALSKHNAAMIDGVLHDTYDSSRDGTRCVYGYWIKESSDD